MAGNVLKRNSSSQKKVQSTMTEPIGKSRPDYKARPKSSTGTRFGKLGK